MVPACRRGVVAGTALVAAVLLCAAGALLRMSTSAPSPQPAEVRAASTGSTVPTADVPAGRASARGAPGISPGRGARVAVTAATVWNEPGQARPVDEPSLTNPVDLDRWTSTMTVDDKLWLVDRLATQVLYGDKVWVREVQGDWARVVVPGQPSSQDPGGYPGWLPVVQLVADEGRDGGDGTGRTAVVTRPTAALRDPTDTARPLLDLSFSTRLAVVGVSGPWVTVATPTGGRAVLAAGDVDVQGDRPPSATGTDLVRSARLFSGLPYLWAGTSAKGFDCSGFTAAVYGVHGIVLPRDADDQALAGSAVDRAGLQPGDLLFYASDGGRGSIYHVSMYVGNGMMIQSPATGRTVETVPVDTPSLARQFWGARRYLPGGAT